MFRLPHMLDDRREASVGVSLDLSTPTGMTCIVACVENENQEMCHGVERGYRRGNGMQVSQLI